MAREGGSSVPRLAALTRGELRAGPVDVTRLHRQAGSVVTARTGDFYGMEDIG